MYGRARAKEPAGEAVDQTPIPARLDDAVSVGEIEDARLGFFHLLSRRFGREFKERHGDDLFAQALYEFSRKVEQGEEIRNPAAWITRCAWNRSIDEKATRDRRPQLVATESLPSEPVAEPSWQPEDSVLWADRMRKVRDAVDQLPGYQRELIARTYFEGESVREASRNLGWSEGRGARAHNAARKKLRAIFGELQSGDLTVIGLAAFFSLSAEGRGTVAHAPSGLDAALDRAGHAVSDGWHRAVDLARHPLGGGRSADLASSPAQAPGRISQLGRRIIAGPVAETAAAAGDGPGRVVEVCKVLVVCAVSGTAVTAGIIGAGNGHQHANAAPTTPAPRHAAERRPPRSRTSEPPPAPEDTTVGQAPAEPPAASEASPTGSTWVAHSVSGSKTAAPSAVKEKQAAPDAGGSEEEEESSSRDAFGAFGGRGESETAEPQASGAEVESLSDAKSSSTTEAAEPSPPPAPKETAEKQAAQEQFHGGLR